MGPVRHALPITPALRACCAAIIAEGKSFDEWVLVASDDMFQFGQFEGGFDAIEQAFCFSDYNLQGSEFWFQLTLAEVAAVASGLQDRVEVRPAAQ